MDKFPNPLDMRLQPDGFHYMLLRRFEVDDDVLGNIVVAAGFLTDLGSIPRLFWNIIPPNGKPTNAYVIHDWLYAKQFWSRKDADDCLFRMMRSLGVGALECWVVWTFLRWFGGFAWREDARKKCRSGR